MSALLKSQAKTVYHANLDMGATEEQALNEYFLNLKDKDRCHTELQFIEIDGVTPWFVDHEELGDLEKAKAIYKIHLAKGATEDQALSFFSKNIGSSVLCDYYYKHRETIETMFDGDIFIINDTIIDY